MVVNPISGTPVIAGLKEDLKVKKEHDLRDVAGDSVSISEDSRQILQSRAYAKEIAVRIGRQDIDVRQEKVSLARTRLENNFYQNEEVTKNVAENILRLIGGGSAIED